VKDSTDEAADTRSPDEEGAPAPSPPSDEALAELGDKDAVFELLWKRTLEAWDDDKPHRAILEHALASEKLPDLAGRYRALSNDPDKGTRAQKKIDGIVVAATQLLMATKTPPRSKTPWQWTASIAFVFAVVCAWLFYQLFVPHRR
jgi:hypothetical protein